jgi:hypothetical protein
VTEKRGRVFVVDLRPLAGCADPVKALRRGLKFLLQACQLKCTDVRETEEIHDGGNSETEACDTRRDRR